MKEATIRPSLKQKQLGGVGQKQVGEEAVISYSLGRPRPRVPTCICIIASFAGVETGGLVLLAGVSDNTHALRSSLW